MRESGGGVPDVRRIRDSGGEERKREREGGDREYMYNNSESNYLLSKAHTESQQ